MTVHERSASFKKIACALLSLLFVLLACGVPGASPSDPAVQEPAVVEGLTFQGYLGMLKVIAPNAIMPWIVSPIPPPQGGGTVSFSGWGPNQTDMRTNEPPTIALYEVAPKGCGQGYTLGRKIGETTVAVNEHRWYISDLQISPDVTVLGAVIIVKNNTGPVSNLLVFNEERLKPKITSPQADEKLLFSADFSGTALPGLCLRLWRGNQMLGRTETDRNGNWAIKSVTLLPGENRFELWLVGRFRLSFPEPVRYTFQGASPPGIVWPFEIDNKYGKYEGYITTWFGFNDAYKKMYAAGKLTTDFHVGIDIGGVSGKTVMSVASGTVKDLHFDDDNSCGIYVKIEHKSGWVSTYCHLKSIDSGLTKGIEYPAGTPLGVVGCTGRYWDAKTQEWKRTCFGDHLHLQMKWSNGQWVNLNPPAGTTFFGGKTYDLKFCASPLGVWGIDWSKVEVKEKYDATINDGIYFEQLMCPANQICTCVKK